MRRISHWINGATGEGTSERAAPVFDLATGRQQAAVDLGLPRTR